MSPTRQVDVRSALHPRGDTPPSSAGRCPHRREQCTGVLPGLAGRVSPGCWAGDPGRGGCGQCCPRLTAEISTGRWAPRALTVEAAFRLATCSGAAMARLNSTGPIWSSGCRPVAAGSARHCLAVHDQRRRHMAAQRSSAATPPGRLTLTASATSPRRVGNPGSCIRVHGNDIRGLLS